MKVETLKHRKGDQVMIIYMQKKTLQKNLSQRLCSGFECGMVFSFICNLL